MESADIDTKINAIIEGWGGATIKENGDTNPENWRAAVVAHVNDEGNLGWFEPDYLDPFSGTPSYRIRGPVLAIGPDLITFQGGTITPPTEEHADAIAWWRDQVPDWAAEAKRIIATLY